MRGVFEEIKKIDWPSGGELGRDTLTVIQTIFLFAVFFLIIDSGVQWILSFLLSL